MNRVRGSKKGQDGKFFNATAKGEIKEWKADLNSFNKEKIKTAVKKVIAAMTVGRDVSSLFTDVIKGLQTDNVELKKLVYLYIINYARSQPDKAILIVNTFQKDATDQQNPMIRALAIRTMGCIRVDRITEYLCEPLAKALKDRDPYVKKTAAVCVAKLYDINSELVEEQGFLDMLRDLISDSNPMVVANAVASLAEIAEASDHDVFQINRAMLAKLLAALNECTEWGQVFILDCLSRYDPSPKDAEDVIERVGPRLKHANSAVAMSAVKVIMKYMEAVTENKALIHKLITEKLPPPLITLLSETRPEIQYVALRNINLIVQRQPQLLANGVKHFFCKYNDPIYVKMEKLEIMIRIASNRNIEKVLLEFKEYASEVDVEFVRKAVLAIGRCAIKLEKAAERCVKVLLELIQTKVNYVVQEAIIVIKDIFRKYPNQYESIIATLCENLDTLDEPDAKASMIWIVGEYAARIGNAHELLESFLDGYHDESPQVQLQLLTAVVKLFLVKPAQNKMLVEKILHMATQNSDNPDLRDRGYVYWRLLSSDPESARLVVCAEKPTISDENFQLDRSQLALLISNISTLASVYHKPPSHFIKEGKSKILEEDDEEEEDEEEYEEEYEASDGEEEEAAAPAPAAQAGGGGGELDLFGALGVGDAAAQSSAPAAAPEGKILLDAQKGKGLQISATYSNRGGVAYMDMHFVNQSSKKLTKAQFKFRQNRLGVSNDGNPSLELGPGQSQAVTLKLKVDGSYVDNSRDIVEMAIKTELAVSMFSDSVPPSIFCQPDGKVSANAFVPEWKSLGSDSEQTKSLNFSAGSDLNTLIQSFVKPLEGLNIFHIATRNAKGTSYFSYYSLKIRGVTILLEISLKGTVSKVSVRSKDQGLAGLLLADVAERVKGLLPQSGAGSSSGGGSFADDLFAM